MGLTLFYKLNKFNHRFSKVIHLFLSHTTIIRFMNNIEKEQRAYLNAIQITRQKKKKNGRRKRKKLEVRFYELGDASYVSVNL